MRASGVASAVCFAALLIHPGTSDALDWPDVSERVERGLASADPASRRSAAEALGTLGSSRATPLVLRAMTDSETDVRVAAASAAIRLRIAAATEGALPWLTERDAKLRIKACDVARALPSPRAVDAIARAISDADPLVRAACVDALGAQISVDAALKLSGKLDDPTPAVRSQVARALARLGDARAVVPLVGKVQDSVPEVRRDVVRALGDLGDARATHALLLSLRDTVAEVKVEALGALGRLRAPEAAPVMAPLALDRNPSIRQAALKALGQIATPDAVRALTKALGTHEDATAAFEHTSVRDALVSAGGPAVVELTALLAHPIAEAVGTSLAWVLGELHAVASAPSIVAALRKGFLPAAAALRALAGAGTPDQLPVVLEFVADPSPVVREQARRAVMALLDPARPDGRAVDPLVATLRTARSSPAERAEIASLLGRTGAPRAATELAGLVPSKDRGLRLAAIDALGELGGRAARPEPEDGAADGVLVPLLGDADPEVRLRAAVALAASGGTKARTELLEKLDAAVELDRYAALTALGGILERRPDERTAKRLFAMLDLAAGPERDAVIEAAGRTHLPSVVKALEDLASKSDADDRRMVAEVLAGHSHSPAALALARSLTRDADAGVRAQAAFTLGAIGDASSLPLLASLATAADHDVATNAAGGVARRASVVGSRERGAIAAVACPMLDDRRSAVRANALAALTFAHARCAGGLRERAFVSNDPSDFVRSAAARALAAAPLPDDRRVLERCASTDPSGDVAHVCRSHGADRQRQPPRPRAVTIFVFGDVGTTAKPRAPFLLGFAGGILRSGTADRRGAVFESAAPEGDVELLRSPL